MISCFAHPQQAFVFFLGWSWMVITHKVCYGLYRPSMSCPILRQGLKCKNRPWFQDERFLLCTHPSKTLHLWRTGRSDGEPLPMKNDIGRWDVWEENPQRLKTTINRSKFHSRVQKGPEIHQRGEISGYARYAPVLDRSFAHGHC